MAASPPYHTIHKRKLIHDKASASTLSLHAVPCTATGAAGSLGAAFWSWWCISIYRNVAKSICSSASPSFLPGGQYAKDSQITHLAVQHQWKLQCPFLHKQAALIRLENGASLWSVLLQWPALPEQACASHNRWAFQTPRVGALMCPRRGSCHCAAAVWLFMLTP